MKERDSKNEVKLLLGQFEEDLFDQYLPFHERFVIDHLDGGFMCSVFPDGTQVSDEKTTWYQGRGLWVYSFLYNNFGGDPHHLDTALKTWAMLQRSEPKEPEGLWPRVLQRDGSPASPPDEEIYGDLFIAEGLAELSKAASDMALWDQARGILLKCVRRYDLDDYFPVIGQTYLGAAAPKFAGARILGVWMVFLRTLTQMLKMRPDAELEALAHRSTAAVMQHHLNPRFGLLNELVCHDLSRPHDDYEQLVYLGHAIETLWMIFEEGQRRGDTAMLEQTAALFRRHVVVAEDRVYGGLFRNLMHVDQNLCTTDKTLFPHQEAILGALMLWEHNGDEWARRCFRQIYDYTRRNFPMTELGSPLWQVAADRFVTLNPKQARAENYHHPRFLMLSILLLRKMQNAS